MSIPNIKAIRLSSVEYALFIQLKDGTFQEAIRYFKQELPEALSMIVTHGEVVEILNALGSLDVGSMIMFKKANDELRIWNT